MTRRFAARCLILFGLVQLPFSLVAVAMLAGYALDGPDFFYRLHDSLTGPGPADRP